MLGADFQCLAHQQEAEDKQHGVVIDLAAGRGCEGYVSGVNEGHTGAERHQSVHVGGAVTQATKRIGEDAAARPGNQNSGEGEQRPAQHAGRCRVKPWKHPHQRVVNCAHLCAQRHGQKHGHGAGDDHDPGFARSRSLGFASGGCGARAGKHGIVTGLANGRNQLFRRSDGRIEDYARTMRHQVHARLRHSGGGAKRFLNVMLAGCASHANYRQRDRFRSGFRHVKLRVGWERTVLCIRRQRERRWPRQPAGAPVRMPHAQRPPELPSLQDPESATAPGLRGGHTHRSACHRYAG